MTVWQVLWIILKDYGAPTVIVGIVLYIWIKYRLKSSIQHEYNVKLEEIKGRIKGESEAGVAAIKAEHERLLTEHKIRFSQLHAKQARAIGEVYGALLQAEEDLGDAFNPARSTDCSKEREKLDTARSSFERFSRVAMANRIYFGKLLCEKLDDLRKIAKDARGIFTMYQPIPDCHKDNSDIIADRNNRYQAYEQITEKFAMMREFLEDDFRAILGSEKD